MKRIILLLAILMSCSVYGQLLTKERGFSKADTLRGTLGPERTWFDVTFYNLKISINPKSKRIEGFNDIHFKVVDPVTKMQIDLFENLQVDSIMMNNKPLKYTREFNAVFIEMPVDLKVGEMYALRFYYSGTPTEAEHPPWDGGFVWSKDKNGKDWIGVACEGMGASAWWPNKDHLSDEPDSMLISVAVPNDISFVGNGNLRKRSKEGDMNRYDWFVSYPINNYNVTVNAGDYVHFGEEYTSPTEGVLALDYYVLSSNLDKAKEHFKQVKPMMKCFEQYLGPYPFWDDGFALVETPYLGMEHQGAIAYGNEYKSGYAGNTRFTGGHDFDYIIIHETGHEWWGNSVSCKDIADLWIHEGFCTYSESIYVECLNDKEAGITYINSNKKNVGNKEAIIGPYGVNKEGSGDMYQKGSLFLNTLRHVINNDKLWWEIILGIATDFKHTVVDTQDIIDYMNDKSNMKLDKIFDQYLRYPDIPTLEYKLEEKGKHTILSYRWKSDVKGFDLPMRYQANNKKWVKIKPSETWQSVKIKKTKSKNVKLDERGFYVKLEKK